MNTPCAIIHVFIHLCVHNISAQAQGIEQFIYVTMSQIQVNHHTEPVRQPCIPPPPTGDLAVRQPEACIANIIDPEPDWNLPLPCRVCEMWINGWAQMEDHVRGRKHQLNMKKMWDRRFKPWVPNQIGGHAVSWPPSADIDPFRFQLFH